MRPDDVPSPVGPDGAESLRRTVEPASERPLLDRVLDHELPRYAEAIERLGQ